MNSWSELAELLSQLPVMTQVNTTKKQLDAIRPLPQEVEGRVMQKLRLEWNYHSNAIEGNKLTYGETYSFLMYGLTAKGKPFKDHLDIKGHNEAIVFLTSLVKDDLDLTEVDIRNLHKMILVEPYQSPAQTADGQATSKTIRIGEYKQQPNHVLTPTGEIHYFAKVEETPIKMFELVQWYNEARQNEKIHPSVLAAMVHHRFVNIHPFDDANGRLARILMNLILMKNGYPPAIVRLKERSDYYQALNQADRNEYVPLIEFLAETVLDSMNLYLKAARGESIEDDADLDKEIALFKQELGLKHDSIKIIKSDETIRVVIVDVIKPFLLTLERKLTDLDSLFFNRTNELIVQISSEGIGRILFKKLDNFEECNAIKKNNYSLKPHNWQVEDLEEMFFTNRWRYFQNSEFHIDFEFNVKIGFGKGGYRVSLELQNKTTVEIGNGIYGIEDENAKIKLWVSKIIRTLMSDIKKSQSY